MCVRVQGRRGGESEVVYSAIPLLPLSQLSFFLLPPPLPSLFLFPFLLSFSSPSLSPLPLLLLPLSFSSPSLSPLPLLLLPLSFFLLSSSFPFLFLLCLSLLSSGLKLDYSAVDMKRGKLVHVPEATYKKGCVLNVQQGMQVHNALQGTYYFIIGAIFSIN